MNRQFLFRSLALVVVLTACALFAPRTLRAQDAIDCRCDSINVVNNSNSTATLCILSAVIRCHDFGPGTTTRIPCVNGPAIGIRDCNGTLHQITGGCITLAIAPGCCVRVCLIQSAVGCYTVTINPSPILCICS